MTRFHQMKLESIDLRGERKKSTSGTKNESSQEEHACNDSSFMVPTGNVQKPIRKHIIVLPVKINVLEICFNKTFENIHKTTFIHKHNNPGLQL